MTKTTKTKRILAFLLTFTLVFSCIGLPGATLVASALEQGETVTIIAGSDLQNTEQEETNVKSILAQLQADTQDADAFLSCGDYDAAFVDAASTKTKIENLTAWVTESGVVAEDAQTVYIQGNHDSTEGIGDALANSGNNDPESGAYGVYVMNYCDTYGTAATVETAEALRLYMNEKLEQGYSKPIFVLSHVPLHYSMRVYNDNDPEAIDYVFSVLNEAGEKGLNIIFLFGHNHSSWDHYLGGGAIYLKKGDQIFIGKRGDVTDYNVRTLNFTYMNAGYLGYYDAAGVSGVDTTLTMTKFEITGDDVTITRYSKYGEHNLKSQGVRNTAHNEVYPPNKTTYASPQVVELSTVTDTTSIPSAFLKAYSVVLNGVLTVNIKVDTTEADLSEYTVEATVDGRTTQILDDPAVANGWYVYKADLMVHDLHKTMQIVLKKGSEIIDEGEFSFAAYKSKLEAAYAEDTQLLALIDSLQNYGSYAAYYADNSFTLTAVPAVEAVEREALEAYKPIVTSTAEGNALDAVSSLYIDKACDFRLKFNSEAFAGCTLLVNDEEIDEDLLIDDGSEIMWVEFEVIPEQWDEPYSITVVKDETEIFSISYSVMSYAYSALGSAQETKTGLNNLLKAMYLYQVAANAYSASYEDTDFADNWDCFGMETAMDRDNTYAAKGVDGNTTIFVGDSFLAPDVWTSFETDLDLTQVDALALGVGGSTAVDWLNYIYNEMFLYDIAPKNVVFNLGNNDLHWRGYTPEQYASYMQNLLNKVHSIMPETKLYMFSVVERQEEAGILNNASVAPANELMQAWCAAQGDWITYVDIYSESATYRLTTDLLLESDHVHPQLETYSTIFLPALEVAGLEMNAPIPIEYTMISSQAELQALSGQAGYYQLSNALVLDSSFTAITGFAGTLDGGGYTITTGTPLFDCLNSTTVQNLTIALSGDITASGVLADTAKSATVTNVHLVGDHTVTAPEASDAGGLVGTAEYSTFKNCSNAAAITGTQYVGGIAGSLSGSSVKFIACINSGTVYSSAGYAGGILGGSCKNLTEFAGCSNTGAISTDGSWCGAGGIVGEAKWANHVDDSIYIYSYGTQTTVNEGTISGYYAGGIVGYAHDGTYLTIENAVNQGVINDGGRSNSDTRVGGILGFAQHGNSIVKLNTCSNKAAVTGGIVGGILGHAAEAPVTITGGSNSGLVTGESELGIGGIVGRVDGSAANVTISGATNNGTVKMYDVSGQSRVGGIAGYLCDYGSVAITNCTNAGTIYGGIVGGVVGHGQNGNLTITGCTNEGPVATTSSHEYVWAGGIVALVQNDTQTAVITGNTNTGYVTAHSGAYAVSQSVAQCDGTNTVDDNTASGFDARCANAVEITDWSQITDMWGTYILTGDITTNGTTYDFHGRLYGAGHTIYTATTLFGNTSNAQLSIQDLNVVLTANLTARSIIINEQYAAHETVAVTFRNVHTSAKNGAVLTGTGDSTGALAGECAHTHFINCSNSVPIASGDSVRVGGLVGWTKMGYCVNFTNCSNSGSITGSVTGNLGGVVGQAHADSHNFTKCSNSGSITAAQYSNGVGGIVGYLPCQATFANCSNTGSIYINGDDPGEGAGGILGRVDNVYSTASTTITNCTNSGTVRAKYAGGIVGLALDGPTVNISNCKNSGAITGTTVTGGIIGLIRGITLTLDENTCTPGDDYSYIGGQW